METSHAVRAEAQAQAEQLLQAISTAEAVIVTTIERECEALRAGQALAARALHTRLCDAAKLYLNAIRAARISVGTLEQVLPGVEAFLEGQREAFSALLKMELAILAAEHEAVGEDFPALSFTGETLLGRASGRGPEPKARPPMPVAAMPEIRDAGGPAIATAPPDSRRAAR